MSACRGCKGQKRTLQKVLVVFAIAALKCKSAGTLFGWDDSQLGGKARDLDNRSPTLVGPCHERIELKDWSMKRDTHLERRALGCEPLEALATRIEDPSL